jgi:hypothetical protein
MPANDTPANSVARELFDEMSRWPIYDPHTHIDPHRPAARQFDEILGYHYYTELAHSTGMPAQQVAADLDPSVRVHNLAAYLDRIDSTVQYSWLLEIARTFQGFRHARIMRQNIGELVDRSNHERDAAEWDGAVWKTSRLEAVFLTNYAVTAENTSSSTHDFGVGVIEGLRVVRAECRSPRPSGRALRRGHETGAERALARSAPCGVSRCASPAPRGETYPDVTSDRATTSVDQIVSIIFSSTSFDGRSTSSGNSASGVGTMFCRVT